MKPILNTMAPESTALTSSTRLWAVIPLGLLFVVTTSIAVYVLATKHPIDHLLTFCKYGGAMIATVYGVIATLTDFHERKHGKNVISLIGYMGIALLISSAVLSEAAEYQKDQRDTANEVQTKSALDTAWQGLQEASQNIQKNLVSTQSVLTEQKKLFYPISKFEIIGFRIEWSLNRNGLKPYGKRLQKELGNVRLPVSKPYDDRARKISIGWMTNLGGVVNDEIVITPDSLLWPTPQEAPEDIFDNRRWSVYFYKPEVDWSSMRKRQPPDFGGGVEEQVSRQLYYNPKRNTIAVSSWGPMPLDDSNYYLDRQKFPSVLDLPGSSLSISYYGGSRIDDESHLSSFVLDFANNELLPINLSKCLSRINASHKPEYLCTLGKTDLPHPF